MPSHAEAVRAELDADTLGRGYSGMTDAEVSADMNGLNCETWVAVPVCQLFDAVSAGALSGLTAAKRADVDLVLSMGNKVDYSPGSRVRVMLTGAFAGKPATLTALTDVAKRMVSRANELSCIVTTATVAAARAL